MQQGNFIKLFLARHVSGTYAHNQEHQKLSCSIWFPAHGFWMGGGLDSRCVGRVYGADGTVFSSTLKMVTVCSETSVYFHQITQLHNPLDIINKSLA